MRKPPECEAAWWVTALIKLHSISVLPSLLGSLLQLKYVQEGRTTIHIMIQAPRSINSSCRSLGLNIWMRWPKCCRKMLIWVWEMGVLVFWRYIHVDCVCIRGCSAVFIGTLLMYQTLAMFRGSNVIFCSCSSVEPELNTVWSSHAFLTWKRASQIGYGAQTWARH